MNHLNLNYLASAAGLFIGCVLLGNDLGAQDCATPGAPTLSELTPSILQVTGGPANRWGATIAGPNPLPPVPFGSGTLCTSAPWVRGSMFLTDSAGSATTDTPAAGNYVQAFIRQDGGWTLSNRIYLAP